jgi:hypothetical protein
MKNPLSIKLVLFFLLSSFIISGTNAQNYLLQDSIRNDTTWSSDTVKIYNDIVIENQAMLQIDPGVYVEFQGNYSLDVYGKIIANGFANDSIVFTVNNHDAIDDTSTSTGGWGSIKLLTNSSDTSKFNYCRFSYGKAVVPGEWSDDPYNEDNKGGAIYLNGYANLIISNSIFYHNRANHAGGGIIVKNCSSVRLLNNIFKYNNVYHYGGGALIESANHTIVYANQFILNTALHIRTIYPSGAGGVGGGLAVYCNSTITSNNFYNNNSVSGALYESSYNSLIYNNIVANNRGPGMLVCGWSNSISKLFNNTIVNNLHYSPHGCGFYFFSRFAIMRNNIVYGNDFDDNFTDPIQIYTPDTFKANFSYGCNPDEPLYYEGEGNIHDDPMFVNPTAGAGPDYDGSAADWSLQNSSPCVNTGTPDTTGLYLPEFDIAGNPRLYGIRIDMGAYENQVVVGLPKNPLVNSKIEIIPNPFKDRFSINLFGENKISRISVLNQSGITIRKMEQLPTDGFMLIDLNGYTSGLYLVVVEYADGTRKVEKVLKK